MNRFDEMTKEVAQGQTRREVLLRLVGGLAGAVLASLGVGPARGDRGGNSACAQWCSTIYPAGPLRDTCVSDAAMCMSGNYPEACAVSLCYQCGPAAPAGHGALCGTSTLRFCCETGGNITASTCTANGTCSYTCASGYATCGPSSPCGINLETDPNNCNACLYVCPTGHCEWGQCCAEFGESCLETGCCGGLFCLEPGWGINPICL